MEVECQVDSSRTQFWPPAKGQFHRAISIMPIFDRCVDEPLSYHAAAVDPHPIDSYRDIQRCWRWDSRLHLEESARHQTPGSKNVKIIRIWVINVAVSIKRVNSRQFALVVVLVLCNGFRVGSSPNKFRIGRLDPPVLSQCSDHRFCRHASPNRKRSNLWSESNAQPHIQFYKII
jgi:hypothetical protein